MRHRQAILSLLVLGRITPREAERLLVAWNAGREEIWLIGACIAICAIQTLSPLSRVAQTFLPGGLPALHHALSAITYGIGGTL